MATREEVEEVSEFFQKLRNNELKNPNKFTIGMGKLIKKAREDNGMSQAELAKKINRRPATISDIENGKSEIGILTLVLLAIEFNQPISYFFPESLFRDNLIDVKTPFQYEMLQAAKEIEEYGGESLTKGIVNLILNHYELSYKIATGEIDPEDYENN
jgi:transcriptional regulator with XRE-family HTH domain